MSIEVRSCLSEIRLAARKISATLYKKFWPSIYTTVLMVTSLKKYGPGGDRPRPGGDIFIIIGAFTLPMGYSVVAAALGGMLADLLSGYAIYIPITLVAKGLMALVCSLAFYKDGVKVYRFILGAIGASLLMVLTYFIFEGIYYGWGAAVANLPAQIIQPAITVPIGLVMIFALKKVKYFNVLKEKVSFKRNKTK